MLVVNYEEAEGHVDAWFLKVVDYLGADHQSRVLAALELGDVDDLELIRRGRVSLRSRKALGDGLDHGRQLVCLYLSLAVDSVVGARDEADDGIGLALSSKVWVDSVSHRKVLNSLVVPLEVLQDGTPVEEQVWVWLLHVSLGQRISLE